MEAVRSASSDLINDIVMRVGKATVSSRNQVTIFLEHQRHGSHQQAESTFAPLLTLSA